MEEECRGNDEVVVYDFAELDPRDDLEVDGVRVGADTECNVVLVVVDREISVFDDVKTGHTVEADADEVVRKSDWVMVLTGKDEVGLSPHPLRHPSEISQ